MSWIASDLPQKQCCECFFWYPADRHHWALQSEGRYGLASRCKLCTKEVHALLDVLKAAHPKPPEGSPCERCGQIPTARGTRGRGLLCDHDHLAEPGADAFRAWICSSCSSRTRRPFVRSRG